MRWQPLPDASPAFVSQLRRSKRSKFLTDESLGPGIIQFFRWYRMNAITVWDVGLDGRSDETIFACAWKQRRILLTHDDDFWDDRRFPEHRNPGVVILPGANGDQRDMLIGLLWMMRLTRQGAEHWLKHKIRITRDINVYIKYRSKKSGAMVTDHMRLGRGPHAMIFE